MVNLTKPKKTGKDKFQRGFSQQKDQNFFNNSPSVSRKLRKWIQASLTKSEKLDTFQVKLPKSGNKFFRWSRNPNKLCQICLKCEVFHRRLGSKHQSNLGWFKTPNKILWGSCTMLATRRKKIFVSSQFLKKNSGEDVSQVKTVLTCSNSKRKATLLNHSQTKLQEKKRFLLPLREDVYQNRSNSKKKAFIALTKSRKISDKLCLNFKRPKNWSPPPLPQKSKKLDR